VDGRTGESEQVTSVYRRQWPKINGNARKIAHFEESSWAPKRQT
jgi:hypothetical protein